jgi:hypothetical protein
MKNVADPTGAYDAANKQYVDSLAYLGPNVYLETITYSPTSVPTSAPSIFGNFAATTWYDGAIGSRLTATASATRDNFYYPNLSFDNQPTTYWISPTNSGYNQPSGAWTGAESFGITVDGVHVGGHWIALDFGKRVQMTKYYVMGGTPGANATLTPTQWVIATSNDYQNWTSWHTVNSNVAWSSTVTNELKDWTPGSPAVGRYVVMIVKSIGTVLSGSHPNIELVSLRFDMNITDSLLRGNIRVQT